MEQAAPEDAPDSVDDDQPPTEDRDGGAEDGAGSVLPGVRRPTVTRTNRRRRPTGEAPPLPRQLNTSGKWWLGLLAVVTASWIVVSITQLNETAISTPERSLFDWLSEVRTPWQTTAMKVLGSLATSEGLVVLFWSSLLVTVIWRRWRHLLVWIGAMVAVQTICGAVSNLIRRPRPLGVEILGSWQGFSMPSRPMAVLAVVLISGLYALVPSGRPRTVGKVVVGVALGLTGLSRIYLAQDWPSDVVAGVVLGVAIPLAAFRLLTPSTVFPISYRRGTTAHLDITPRRRAAIEAALRDQLGVIPVEIAPFGLDGSGGSTPLRITVKGDPDITSLFGKLYAKTHLRSDRWYKLGRMLLYGRLEDEKPFETVRRLVQHEDHLLWLLRNADVPVPEPYGIVEITPEREYMIVMEFIEGGQEIAEADVDDAVIDQGLEIVRRLWEAGLAHRDIKPANLLVRDGELILIDSAFGEVRPSPWRQAVDLGNMMLVLALRTSPQQVYERASHAFSVDEIAEAFAATRGVTMPTQLRQMIREDGRDLHAEFTALLPARRRPIRIQRWSMRRLGLILATTAAAIIGGVGFVILLRSPL